LRNFSDARYHEYHGIQIGKTVFSRVKKAGSR